jgi:hypothetical protein
MRWNGCCGVSPDNERDTHLVLGSIEMNLHHRGAKGRSANAPKAELQAARVLLNPSANLVAVFALPAKLIKKLHFLNQSRLE